MIRRLPESRTRGVLAVVVLASLAGCAAKAPAGRGGAPTGLAGAGASAAAPGAAEGLLARLLSPITSLWSRGSARAVAAPPGASAESVARATGAGEPAGAAEPTADAAVVDPSKASAPRPKRRPIDPARWLASPPGLRSPLPLLAVVDPAQREVSDGAQPAPREEGFAGRTRSRSE